MNVLQAVLLSIVEGVTEFLPISSTGHLILASNLLGIIQSEVVKSFEIVIQLGAILAVVVLYFKRVITNFAIWQRVGVAFVPTAVVGFLLYKVVKQLLLGNSMVVVVSLFLGGLLMIILEQVFKRRKQIGGIEQMSLGQAFGVGVVQSLSIIPGVSRAAATIYGGMGVGLSREEATEFSFLLAVPTMVAAVGLDVIKSREVLLHSCNLGVLAVGFLGAFITALVTVKWLIGWVKKHSLVGFGIYRMVVAGIFLWGGMR